MSADQKFLMAAGAIFVMLVVAPAAPGPVALLALILLTCIYMPEERMD